MDAPMLGAVIRSSKMGQTVISELEVAGTGGGGSRGTFPLLAFWG